jgi:hypothetical protein
MNYSRSSYDQFLIRHIRSALVIFSHTKYALLWLAALQQLQDKFMTFFILVTCSSKDVGWCKLNNLPKAFSKETDIIANDSLSSLQIPIGDMHNLICKIVIQCITNDIT